MQQPTRDTVPASGDRRRLKIGLLGGSFNPAHQGHIAVARRALRTLGLDEVWLLVSPGNPLKAGQRTPPAAERFRALSRLIHTPRLRPTLIESRIGTRYTADTIRALKRLFPLAQFVWIMGADVFAQLPRWRRWKDVLRSVPVAVLPRPGSNYAALHGQAAAFLQHHRVRAGAIRTLAAKTPPAWAFLPGPQNSISSTELRRTQQ